MQLHQLQPLHKPKKEKRIGRGGKRGTYCGRGVKGQKARAGRKMKPIIREIIKKYPKKRGYRFNPLREKPAIVNVKTLEEKFKEGEQITPSLLVQRRIVRKRKGRIPQIKILGKGEIKKPLVIMGCEVSETAKQKIEKAGGKILK